MSGIVAGVNDCGVAPANYADIVKAANAGGTIALSEISGLDTAAQGDFLKNHASAISAANSDIASATESAARAAATAAKPLVQVLIRVALS